MSRGFVAVAANAETHARKPEEHVFLDARRHGVVLVRPLCRALVLALLGSDRLSRRLARVRSPAPRCSCLAAVVAIAAVWRWDRTHVVLTGEKLFVMHGVVRRRAAAVRLERVGTVEIEQSLPGRLLGYGTIVAGDLEIRCVAKPGSSAASCTAQRLSRATRFAGILLLRPVAQAGCPDRSDDQTAPTGQTLPVNVLHEPVEPPL